MTYKKERLSNLIKEELSLIVIREMEFGDMLVTLTDVEISQDGKMATINFSVIPAEKSPDVFKILEKNTGHLYHFLRKKITMQSLPHIKFKIDRGLEKAAEIEKILIEEEKKSD